tara:strand:+ start:11968 stop:12621 length:654 start_codon:yes stop_codon:yes gene_type:complete
MHAHSDSIVVELEFGLLSTSGNSEGQTINSQLTFLKDTASWTYKSTLATLSSSSNQNTSAEKYSVDLQADKKLPEGKSLFILLVSEDDRFSGFDYQTSIGLGYGQQIVETSEHDLRLEVGPGYRVNGFETQSNEKEWTLRVGGYYQWKMSETATFLQYLNIEGGDKNTISRLGVNIKSQLISSVALNVGMDAKYTEQVPLGKDHLDTETYARIAYEF